ncbi:MAG: RsmB/NOP family class I SAM-dependent RNA methyltransferase [Pseudomonadota bacterium]
MTPAARVQAAIEVLDRVNDGSAAEHAVTAWARASRFAGSKDRAAVRDHVFQALRCKRSYAVLGGAETGRGLMLGWVRSEGINPEDVFTGDGYAPSALTAPERTAGKKPAGAAAHDLPDWLWHRFVASLGADEAARCAVLLRHRAPVTLRVNLRMKNVAQAVDQLRESDIQTAPLPDVEGALIVTEGARRVARSGAYLSGAVELQDASSQAAMMALDVPSGARVLDYCAGGGGKVLALAARHDAKWFAHDAVPGRMQDLPARAARAGAHIHMIMPQDLAAHSSFDVVLCDAPCSGSGTWRRAPDAKWRLTPERLVALRATQADILQAAQALVSPGGILAYATCSVLEEENNAQIQRFQLDYPGWKMMSDHRWPVSETGDGFYLATLRAPA